MKKLSPEATSILDAARHVDDPTPEDKVRVKHAVMAAVAVSGAAVVSATAASKAAASAAGASIAPAAGAATAGVSTVGVTGLGIVTAKALATITILGASVGVAVTRPWEPTPDEHIAVAVAHEVTPSETSEIQPVPVLAPPEASDDVQPPEASDDVQTEEPVRAPERIAVPRAAQVDTEESEPDTLAAELAVLRQARLALGANDFAGALRALDDHAARFPRGALVAERSGTRALVLCRSSNAAGPVAAQRFLAAYPRSPLAQRVRDACE